MTDFAIEATNLRKSFHGRPAVDGLTVRVPKGSIWGFLGRNGAGKTTTIKLLLGILQPEGGDICILGDRLSSEADAVRTRSRVGFVSEDKELYPYMTVQQIIRFMRPFFPTWRSDLETHYLNLFELPVHKKIPDLSKGMRSKLMLLLAICRGAELLILDEPSDGLDPLTVEGLLRELVSLSAREGTTIFFSSHQLNEVEQIADHITIMDRGRNVLNCAIDDMKEQYRRVNIVFREEPAYPIRWKDGVEHVSGEGKFMSLLINANIDEVLEQARSLPGTSVNVCPVSLKEIFLEHVREA